MPTYSCTLRNTTAKWTNTHIASPFRDVYMGKQNLEAEE